MFYCDVKSFNIECKDFEVADYRNKSAKWVKLWEEYNSTFIDLVWRTTNNLYTRVDPKKIKGLQQNKFGTAIDDRIWSTQDYNKLVIPAPKNAETLFVDFVNFKTEC